MTFKYHHFQNIDKVCELKSSRIDLWLFSLTHQPQWALDVLNADEIERGKRFYFGRHRRRFITARATLRFLLGQYLHQLPQDIHFQYSAHGKPLIENFAGMTFNLSHSGDFALVGIGQDHALGVDIERFSSRSYLELAKSYFAKEEILWLNRVPDSMKCMIFFKIWTQKEAFIKAIGAGLSYPTQTFHAICGDVPRLVRGIQGSSTGIGSLDTADKPRYVGRSNLSGDCGRSEVLTEKFELIDPQNLTAWQLHSMMPMPGFSMALCCHPEIETIQFLTLDPSEVG